MLHWLITLIIIPAPLLADSNQEYEAMCAIFGAYTAEQEHYAMIGFVDEGGDSYWVMSRKYDVPPPVSFGDYMDLCDWYTYSLTLKEVESPPELFTSYGVMGRVSEVSVVVRDETIIENRHWLAEVHECEDIYTWLADGCLLVIVKAESFVAPMSIPPLSDYVASQLTFPIDNDDPAAFGYADETWGDMKPAYEDDLWPISLCVAGDFVLVVDQFHGNVKRIDVASGDLICSDRLTTDQKRPLSDVAVFHGKVYVAGCDSVFVLSKELEYLSSFHFEGQRGWKFVDVSPERLSLFQSVPYGMEFRDFVSFDTLTTIVAYCDTADFFSVAGAHGKYYEDYETDVRWIMETEIFCLEMDIQLMEQYRWIWDKFDGMNNDFDERRLAFFDAGEEEFRLYLFEVIKED